MSVDRLNLLCLQAFFQIVDIRSGAINGYSQDLTAGLDESLICQTIVRHADRNRVCWVEQQPGVQIYSHLTPFVIKTLSGDTPTPLVFDR